MTAMRFLGICFLITMVVGWGQRHVNQEWKLDRLNASSSQHDGDSGDEVNSPTACSFENGLDTGVKERRSSGGGRTFETINYFISPGFVSPTRYLSEPFRPLNFYASHLLRIAKYEAIAGKQNKRVNRANALLADFRPQDEPSLDSMEFDNAEAKRIPHLPLSHPAMDVERHSLCYYRNLMKCGRAPNPDEMLGVWRGVKKGVANVGFDSQFIKEFYYVNGCLSGDNIAVSQVNACALPEAGWQPIVDSRSGGICRQAYFTVECPHGCGPFGHGMVLNYSAAENRCELSRGFWEQVVKLDDNHLLGHASVCMGGVRIPVGFFVLERTAVTSIEAPGPTPAEVPVLPISASLN